MNAIAPSARPSIGPGFRLQWEPVQDAHVLLYPEGMVKLNRSAAAILTRCDGVRTIGEIISDLEQTFGTSGLTDDVFAFIELAVQRSWLKVPE
jgi:pyrroloquinoline quinone biosynthesis protein D